MMIEAQHIIYSHWKSFRTQKQAKLWGTRVLCSLVFVSYLNWGTAQSASNLQEEKVMEQSFLSPDVSTVQLTAFQQRAQQKLKDFAELIALLSNPAYELTLREASIPMAMRLFESPSTVIRYYDFIEKKEKKTTAALYLESLLKAEKQLQIEIMVLSEATVNQTKSTYHWQLEFLQMQKKATGNYPNLKALINVVLVQKEKKFGEKTKLIWEVFLSDMEVITLANP
ncbi:MAG: hypothetical protein AB8G15_10455 [Saprospiraceae bacterium]